MSNEQKATVYEIMQQTTPRAGSRSWEEEFDRIDDRLLTTPIRIGTDHSIVNGRRRLRLAHALGLIDKLPYEIVDTEAKSD